MYVYILIRAIFHSNIFTTLQKPWNVQYILVVAGQQLISDQKRSKTISNFKIVEMDRDTQLLVGILRITNVDLIMNQFDALPMLHLTC